MAKHGNRKSNRAKARVPRTLRKQTDLRYHKPVFNSETIAANWDPNRSAKQNLSKIGLAHNPNRAMETTNMAMGPNFAKGDKAVKQDPCELFDIATAGQMQERDVNERRRALAQLEVDQKYAVKLLAKHQLDYVAMARDIKLNNRQLTPKQLKRMCEKFLSQTETQRLFPVPEGLSSIDPIWALWILSLFLLPDASCDAFYIDTKCMND